MAKPFVNTSKGSSLKRKDRFFLDFDTTKWLQQFGKTVEDFNGKGGAFERAVARMMPLVEGDFKEFMAQHEQTGKTIKSLMDNPNLYWDEVTYYKNVGTTTKGKKGFSGHEVKIDKTKNLLFVEYGFLMDQGGEAALFLDIGRQGITYADGTKGKAQAPTFFVYNTINNRLSDFNKIFREEVMKELGGLL